MAAGQDDGHKAATTISNGRDPGAGNTTEPPKIIVCTPEDIHGTAPTTNNGRGLGAGSLFTPVPDDGRGMLINPFNGDYLVPGSSSSLRQRRSGAVKKVQWATDDVLRMANNTNGRDVESRGAFNNHVARLNAELAELDDVSGPRSYIMTAYCLY